MEDDVYSCFRTSVKFLGDRDTVKEVSSLVLPDFQRRLPLFVLPIVETYLQRHQNVGKILPTFLKPLLQCVIPVDFKIISEKAADTDHPFQKILIFQNTFGVVLNT